LIPQVRIAARLASSDGPSKMPQPSAHAYCVPERFTPRSCTTFPDPSTSSLPRTRTESGTGPDGLVDGPGAELDDGSAPEVVAELDDGAGAVDDVAPDEDGGALEVCGDVADEEDGDGALVDVAGPTDELGLGVGVGQCFLKMRHHPCSGAALDGPGAPPAVAAAEPARTTAATLSPMQVRRRPR
jgi:hypothetical protein